MRNQTVGLSLLKAGEFPWENTDKMRHQFTYSLMCHDKSLSQSDVFDEAYKLNTPLWAAIIEKQKEENVLDPQNFIELEDSKNVIISAFKRSEKDSKKFVLRISEQRGD